jgi:hypothetical protein
MDRFKYLFLPLVFISYMSTAQISDKMNDFAQKLFKTFQTKNYNEFKLLCISRKDFVNEILPILKKDSLHHIPDPLMQQASNFYSTSSRKFLFNYYINQGTKLGITKWGMIKYKKLEIEKQNKNKIESNTLNGNIWFTYKKEPYVIVGIVAIKLSTGYRLSIIRYIIKYKN